MLKSTPDPAGSHSPIHTYRTREEPEPPSGHCPRWDGTWIVALEAPERRQRTGCSTWGCTYCGPRLARRRAALMTWACRHADRARLVTLTQLPRQGAELDWDATRWQMRDLTRRIRTTHRWECAWSVERNPRGTGFHLHAIQFGDYLPQRDLSDLWGSRRVDIRAVRGLAGAEYVVKDVARVGYSLKTAHEDIWAHLALNGGRGCHWTRGFLHGHRLREAESLMRAERRATSPDGGFTWVTTHDPDRLTQAIVTTGELPVLAVSTPSSNTSAAMAAARGSRAPVLASSRTASTTATGSSKMQRRRTGHEPSSRAWPTTPNALSPSRGNPHPSQKSASSAARASRDT